MLSGLSSLSSPDFPNMELGKKIFILIKSVLCSQLFNSFTMKREAAFYCVLSSTVLCNALVRSCVLLLESGNLQHSVGVTQFDFTWEWHVIGSSPADFRNWAVMERKEQIWL